MKQRNKTKQVVTWPTTTYFTIKQLHSLNPKFENITLRVRLAKAIEAGTAAEIGSIPGNHGRPEKVFALTPITQTVLDKAKSNDINLVDNASKLVNVVSVSTPKTVTPVVPTAPTVATK